MPKVTNFDSCFRAFREPERRKIPRHLHASDQLFIDRFFIDLRPFIQMHGFFIAAERP